MRKPKIGLAAFVGLCFLVAASAHAQSARVGGKVTDPQGGVLPGASVVITNPATGLSLEVVTNAAGSYVFPSLDPATYRLEVNMPALPHISGKASSSFRDKASPSMPRSKSQASRRP